MAVLQQVQVVMNVMRLLLVVTWAGVSVVAGVVTWPLQHS